MIDRTTIYSVISMMPPDAMEVSGVTLGSRQPRETGYTSLPWANARRKPADNKEVMMAGGGGNISEEWIEFQLYKNQEVTDPKIGDSITDSDGVVWQIKAIKAKMMRTAFFCTCLKNK